MLKNKVRAIAGAGSGIGRALAAELAARRARLAVAHTDAAARTDTLSRDMGV
jgi:NAD(P)-dependent dehydrogenase (short-subunit alcohol dehydrogenase family)